MYRLVIEELSTGRTSLAAPCRISALSSADYCLGQRQEAGRGHFQWTGTPENIRRLLEAERLCSAACTALEDGKEYGVFFFSFLPACA